MRLVQVEVGDGADAWRRAGFAVDADGCFEVGGVHVCCTGDGEGVRAWTLGVDEPADRPAEVDGLSTRWERDLGAVPPRRDEGHGNGAVLLDHLVVGSPNRDRTVAAFDEALGLAPRRTTQHELYGRRMVQTFFVLRPTVVEVISRPADVGPDERPDGGDGPATFWGLAFTVEDLDRTCALLGDAISEPRDAVQPGRRIASLRHADLGVSVPTAFLTPRSG